jgi:ribosomal small subunit protein bTHX
MGKGDKRSRKGKIWRGSYGNTRRKKEDTKPAFIAKPKAKKVTAPVEANMEATEAVEVAQTEIASAKPKKAAAKKPKVEGEKKAPAKKKAPAEKKKTEE